ncbi:MAG: FMN-binding protein [Streptosporangiaceae bacterium]|nr:FMN-binding protein [Streptosporangiaceae bacterium]
MRRIMLAVAGTVAGLVALLTFRSHVPSAAPVASSNPGTGAGAGAGSGGAGTTGSGAVTGGLAGSGGSGGSGGQSGGAVLTAGERAVDGNVANTAYGPVQIQVVVKKGKIVKVNILEQPSSTAHDLQIGQFAFPQLISETLKAQSARIDAVSGGTYTSGGYIKSLQSAIDNGALWAPRLARYGSATPST